ncbi:MAG: hypothetical protein WD579_03385 [Candidatus Paceibacterota bacterium]
MKDRGTRILFDIVLLISLGILPWWITAILAVGGALYFPRFYEIIIVGAIIDGLYSLYIVPWTTIAAIILFILSRIVRGILRIER